MRKYVIGIALIIALIFPAGGVLAYETPVQTQVSQDDGRHNCNRVCKFRKKLRDRRDGEQEQLGKAIRKSTNILNEWKRMKLDALQKSRPLGEKVYQGRTVYPKDINGKVLVYYPIYNGNMFIGELCISPSINLNRFVN